MTNKPRNQTALAENIDTRKNNFPYEKTLDTCKNFVKIASICRQLHEHVSIQESLGQEFEKMSWPSKISDLK